MVENSISYCVIKKTDRKGNGNQHCRHGIPNRVEIDERPQEANNRPRIGDWEMDLIVGTAHRGAILTMIAGDLL